MGRAKAIHNFCKTCNHDPFDKGTWREQTEACVSSTCSLFEFRPKTFKCAQRRKSTFSRSQAIALQCMDCVSGLESEGTWRQQVEACTSEDCDLYEYRPVSWKKKGKQSKKGADCHPSGSKDNDSLSGHRSCDSCPFSGDQQ